MDMTGINTVVESWEKEIDDITVATTTASDTTDGTTV